MISTTRRSPNATLVTKNSIDQAADALQDLPEKTKEKLSLREAVDVLRDHITAALDKGYSYEDIAVMLAKQGVSIAPSSLKHYLARSNRQLRSAKGGGTQPRRRRTSKTAEESDADELSLPPVELEMEEMDEELEEMEEEEMEEMEEEEMEEEETPKRGRRSSAKASVPESTPARSGGRSKSVAAAPTRKRRSKST